MANHPTIRPAWLLILTGILITVLTLSSCGNETPTMCSFEGVGALEGYLLSSGQGLSAEIRARAMEGPSDGRVLSTTMSDSTGWYRLELATGLYRLEVKNGASLVYPHETRDIIRVLPRVFRKDLVRGRVVIRVGMPEEFEGERPSLWIQGPDFRFGFQHGTVQDGWLQLVFPALQPGSFIMELKIRGLNGQFFLPGTMDSYAADSLTVDTERITTYEVDFRDTYASVSGSVTGSWQEWREWGSEPMNVVAYSSDLQFLGSTQCSIDGSYTYGTFLPQEIRLKSTHRGVDQWLGVESIGDQGVFDLQPGDRITGVDLVECGFQVRLDGPGNLAYHEPSVTLFDEAGNQYTPNVYNENPFSISNLRPGRYFLHLDGYCDNQIWAPQWYEGAEMMADATPIDLVEGEFQLIAMTLVEGDHIEGEILTPDSERPDNVQCGLFDFDGESLCRDWNSWRRFDDGLFDFKGLPNGEYFLAARTDRFAYWWYPGTENFDEATPIIIENHESVTGLSWFLPPPWKAVGP